jgi:hypothetical protein
MSQIIPDFDDIDRITAIVCHPTPSLVIKHTVFLKRKIPARNAYQKEEERGYVFYYNFNNVKGLYLECKGQICLEGHRNVINKEGASSLKKISCYIEMKDIANFLNRLDIVYSWLAGEENKMIYQADSKGRPFRILTPDKKIAVSLSQTTYVAFKPCIIRDMSDVTYEGIAMGSEAGEISNFTASEYASFNIVMHSVLPNLYMANNTLINNAIQMAMYNKLVSIEQKLT